MADAPPIEKCGTEIHAVKTGLAQHVAASAGDYGATALRWKSTTGCVR